MFAWFHCAVSDLAFGLEKRKPMKHMLATLYPLRCNRSELPSVNVVPLIGINKTLLVLQAQTPCAATCLPVLCGLKYFPAEIKKLAWSILPQSVLDGLRVLEVCWRGKVRSSGEYSRTLLVSIDTVFSTRVNNYYNDHPFSLPVPTGPLGERNPVQTSATTYYRCTTSAAYESLPPAGPLKSAESAERYHCVYVLPRIMTALPGHDPVDAHLLPDSERILRAHGGWQTEWDERRDNAIQENNPAEYDDQVQYAIELYAAGKLPIQVRWALAERYGRECRIGSVQRSAEKAIQSAAEAPAPFKRAQAHLLRHTAIQGSLRDCAWGPAMQGINRLGEVAGELDREAALTADDLLLTVAIEGDGDLMLPPGDSVPVSGETADGDRGLSVETGETEGASQG